MAEKGFAFSLEACLALALLAGLLLSCSPPEARGLESLLVMQKGHDLLKAWNARSEENNAAVFERDFRQAFPGRQGRLEIFQEGVLVESLDFLEGGKELEGPRLSLEGLVFEDAFNAFQFRLTIISP